MIDILAIVVLLLFLVPRWFAKWWSTVEFWKRYYDAEGMEDAERRTMVRVRAKNIQRIRNERFSKNGS